MATTEQEQEILEQAKASVDWYAEGLGEARADFEAFLGTGRNAEKALACADSTAAACAAVGSFGQVCQPLMEILEKAASYARGEDPRLSKMRHELTESVRGMLLDAADPAGKDRVSAALDLFLEMCKSEAEKA